ncbi:MAG: hypothetical protein K8R90_08470 [Candidatus Cloacimonetes bacterium]|nr:hypothetical protein [Candidatus Cloacimonadota bacterium]
MNHPLHLKVGTLIANLVSARHRGYKVIMDPACGNLRGIQSQHISLFSGTSKSRETRLCKVDLIIINKDNKVKLICEIEESNVKPIQVCGKFFASALSNFYAPGYKGAVNSTKVYLDEETFFLQIVSTEGLKPESSKPKQWKNIESQIKNSLPLRGSQITEYCLIYGEVGDFDNTIREKLENFLKKALYP